MLFKSRTFITVMSVDFSSKKHWFVKNVVMSFLIIVFDIQN